MSDLTRVALPTVDYFSVSKWLNGAVRVVVRIAIGPSLPSYAYFAFQEASSDSEIRRYSRYCAPIEN